MKVKESLSPIKCNMVLLVLCIPYYSYAHYNTARQRGGDATVRRSREGKRERETCVEKHAGRRREEREDEEG